MVLAQLVEPIVRKIQFVAAEVPSTGPGVVSVNVIDDFTWGAAALSDQTDRCYLVLLVTDRERPNYGTTLFDWLPKGEPCLGASAVPERVRATDWPDAGSDSPSVLENLIIGLLLLGPVTAAIAWAVAEIVKVQDRGALLLAGFPVAFMVVATSLI